MWYTSYCEDQQITVADCHIVLVYLGSGTVRDTKLIQTTGKSCLGTKLPLSSGEEYSPLPKSKVYDLAVKKQQTRSMGLVSTKSSSSADESNSPSPVVTPESSPQPSDTESKPEIVPSKPARGWPRKPKARVVKEKHSKSGGGGV